MINTKKGEYDYISVGEAPNDEVSMTYLIALASGGNVKTTTLKAFSQEKFAEMVNKIP